MKEDQVYTVSSDTTLLLFLQACYSNKSRNYAKGILARRQVSVNGRMETNYGLTLSPGDIVNVSYQTPGQRKHTTLPVLYEDADLLVIEKPYGMLSISNDREREKTAYHILTDYVKGPDKKHRLFIVHRLNRDISGLMLFANKEPVKRTL